MPTILPFRRKKNMEPFDIQSASKMSFKNKSQLQPGTACGCYFCLHTFDAGAVEDWTDQGETALCPRCDIDAVLPGVTEKDDLIAAHERWFCVKSEEGTGFCVGAEGSA